MIGDNTDWIGFLNDLRWHGVDPAADARPEQGAAVVLGAGGSARAIAYALATCGLGMRILNRDEGRAQALASDMRAHFPAAQIEALPLDAASLRDAAHEASLVVNCTSAGMSPDDGRMPWLEDAPFPGRAVLYDLVYKPRVTRLMRLAEASGARAIGGIGMLAEQGAAAFARWTEGRALPVTPREVSRLMRRALEYP